VLKKELLVNRLSWFKSAVLWEWKSPTSIKCPEMLLHLKYIERKQAYFESGGGGGPHLKGWYFSFLPPGGKNRGFGVFFGVWGGKWPI